MTLTSGEVDNDNHFGNWTGRIIILKKDTANNIINLPGFTISVSPNPYGAGILIVVDNGPGGLDPYDTDMTFGTIDLKNIPQGSYTITEIAAPAGYIVDPTPHLITVTSSTPVIVTRSTATWRSLSSTTRMATGYTIPGRRGLRLLSRTGPSRSREDPHLPLARTTLM
ncbi:MAG: hypothetical protein FJ012_11565 [Chloroflexi bacterium]|nr:hypothetical protein [Chloroflexota bacterium]